LAAAAAAVPPAGPPVQSTGPLVVKIDPLRCQPKNDVIVVDDDKDDDESTLPDGDLSKQVVLRVKRKLNMKCHKDNKNTYDLCFLKEVVVDPLVNQKKLSRQEGEGSGRCWRPGDESAHKSCYGIDSGQKR